jgi:hypothetical protein
MMLVNFVWRHVPLPRILMRYRKCILNETYLNACTDQDMGAGVRGCGPPWDFQRYGHLGSRTPPFWDFQRWVPWTPTLLSLTRDQHEVQFLLLLKRTLYQFCFAELDKMIGWLHLHSAREHFTHMFISPLSMKSFKISPMLGTQDLLGEKAT